MARRSVLLMLGISIAIAVAAACGQSSDGSARESTDASTFSDAGDAQPASDSGPTDASLTDASTMPPPLETLFPAPQFQNALTTCGAKGDGTTDDTAALNNCLDSGSIFFPSGTYLVSDTLVALDAYRTFQGENRNNTVIQLASSAGGGFASADASAGQPKPVIKTVDAVSTSGGNNGFHNYVFNLTIDTGKGNPNASGIDFHANNIGALRAVVVRSGDGEGRAGVDFGHQYPGPLMVSNVEVDGFDYGILAGEEADSITLEHLTTKNQNIAGIQNGTSLLQGNSLTIRDLVSSNSVPAVVNGAPIDGNSGFVTLLGATLAGGVAGTQAIVNAAPVGSLYLRDVTTSGYGSVLSNRGAIMSATSLDTLIDTSDGKPESLFSTAVPFDLSVQDTPFFQDNNPSDWADVGKASGGDDTTTIQAALDSGKPVVFFRGGHGTNDESAWYHISDTLHVPATVKQVLGMETFITETKTNAFTDPTNPKPMFRFEAGIAGDQVFVERIGFRVTSLSEVNAVAVDDATPRTLVLRDIELAGLAQGTIGQTGDASTGDPTGQKVIGYANEPGAGPVFFDDVAGQAQFPNPQTAWLRQYDTEGAYSTSPVWDRTLNAGGTLWILGLKTEKAPTIIETTSGGKTQVLGGFLYTSTDSSKYNTTTESKPAFVITNSQASFSFVEQVDTAGVDYQTYVDETQVSTDLTLSSSTVPYTRSAKGGHNVPLFLSGVP